MAAAVEGLQEGLHWGELISSGGSPASILALHTSHPSDQASSQDPTLVLLMRFHLSVGLVEVAYAPGVLLVVQKFDLSSGCQFPLSGCTNIAA